MRGFKLMPGAALLSLMYASALAGCTSSTKAPVNFLELAEVVQDLPGAQGKTLADQYKIDKTVARACGANILGAKQCGIQTGASSDRKKELSQ